MGLFQRGGRQMEAQKGKEVGLWSHEAPLITESRPVIKTWFKKQNPGFEITGPGFYTCYLCHHGQFIWDSVSLSVK